NCHYPIPEGGDFCPSCGQKNLPTHFPFWRFIGELIQDAFSLDSKVIKSIPLLFFAPGELTKQFFKGKRKSYVSPIRQFLFLTIILFAALQFNIGDVAEKFNENTVGENPRFELERDQEHNLMIRQMDSALTDVKSKFNDPRLSAELDSSFKFMSLRENTDSLFAGTLSFFTMEAEAYRFAAKDAFLMDTDSLMDFYTIPEKERFMVKKIIKLNKDGGSFMNFLFQRSAWAIFLMMPFLALFLKLIYIRRKRYYIEHVIFSVHFHSFMFLFLTICLLIVQDLNHFNPVPYFIISAIYLLIAMKRFYGQGYLKTFFKYLLVLIAYGFIASASITLFALAGLVLY
ncbi:MAG: DUF3667 domain-containing protein, partial [Bacteroidota bacterium]